jgi:hypothetical protein
VKLWNLFTTRSLSIYTWEWNCSCNENKRMALFWWIIWGWNVSYKILHCRSFSNLLWQTDNKYNAKSATMDFINHKEFECSYLRVKLLLHWKQAIGSILMNNLGLEGFIKKFSNSVAPVTCYDRRTINIMQKVQLWILFTTRSYTVHTWEWNCYYTENKWVAPLWYIIWGWNVLLKNLFFCSFCNLLKTYRQI